MNFARWLFIIAISAMMGCSGPNSRLQNRHAILYVFDDNPGKRMLAITGRQWRGIWGPEGWVGYENSGYWITLEGNGPVYKNPRFQDNPPDFQCIGEVTLDSQHHQVTIEMRRVISKPDEPIRTTPHPANGTCDFEIKKGSPLLE